MESGTNLLQTLGAYDPLSYRKVLHDIRAWKYSGGNYADAFNYYDQMGHTFFRLIFHFYTNEPRGYGLLHPTWKHGQGLTDWWQHDSAYSYLKMNGEEDRANYLRNFISLLSNINAKSPWYFQSIKGLDEAMSREYMEMELSEPKKITIECLDDSLDNRVGTLLDLYKAACYSHQLKKEIIPRNLRTFNMDIVVMQTPIKSMHHDGGFDTASSTHQGMGINGDLTSYKVLHLKGCHIDINSNKVAYGDLNNAEGMAMKYAIDIHVSDIFESRHNEFIPDLGKITDLLSYDLRDSIEPLKRVGGDLPSLPSNTLLRRP